MNGRYEYDNKMSDKNIRHPMTINIFDKNKPKISSSKELIINQVKSH